MPKTKCVDCGQICWNCRKCRNRTYCEFCNSGSLHGQDEPTPERIRPPRDPGGRLFLVQFSFVTRRGWSDTFDVRVRAKGMAGAVWQGVHQGRRENLKARTHVRQVRVTAAVAALHGRLSVARENHIPKLPFDSLRTRRPPRREPGGSG